MDSSRKGVAYLYVIGMKVGIFVVIFQSVIVMQLLGVLILKHRSYLYSYICISVGNIQVKLSCSGLL